MKNKLLELKIRELTVLKKNFELVDNILYLLDKNKVVLGCDLCYAAIPVADEKGYKINAGNLISVFEKYNDLNIPIEVACNCWLCPKCGRLFQELLPKYDTGGIKNVGI